MTTNDRRQANLTLKMLRREWKLTKDKGCGCKPRNTFSCPCCHVSYLVDQLDSLVNFYMDTDKERAAMEKKWKKGIPV